MQVDIQGPAGRLEGILDEPFPPAPGAPAARFAAVVCHPDPRFGGTMHNHATYRIAKAIRSRGGAALRFNARGVGRSAGSFDAGRGETEDARAALDWLARRRPGLPLLAAGFSFGSLTAALAAGEDPRVTGLLLAGVPLRAPGLEALASAVRLRDVEKPIALVQAEGDEFGPPAELREAIAGSRAPRRLATVRGTTHLFTEDLDALQREAEAAVAWLRGEAP